VYDGVSAVRVEAGLFDDVVEPAGVAHLFEGELGVGFVGGYEADGPDAEEAVEQAPAEAEVNDAEHVEIVDLSVEDASGPLYAIG